MSVLSSELRTTWSRGDRVRITGIISVIAVMHIVGWSMYLYYAHNLVGAGAFAGAGTLAYALGIRHAFDADHIAAIDDTTRLMMQRGKRPVGVGFFFSLGHSTVVLVLALVVAIAAGSATSHGVDAFRHVGGDVSIVVAMSFLLLVAVLNAMVLTGVSRLWRDLTRGRVDDEQIELALLNRGLMNRMLGGRARSLIKSSWHMYPVGVLFGLGLETASEVTLLALSASTVQAGRLPTLAVLTLPLLFAAGMSAFDTVDSLLMSWAYSWSFRAPARRLYYNMATTGMTVVVALFIGTVYLAGVVDKLTGAGGAVAAYAGIADHFELLGYAIVGSFAAAWLGAFLFWRLSGYAARYDPPREGREAGAP